VLGSRADVLRRRPAARRRRISHSAQALPIASLHRCSLRCHQQPLHHVPCKAALVLGSRAHVLRRRPAARRHRISHSAQTLPFATCTRAAARSACTQAALVLGSRADVLRRRPAARSSPAASPPRPVHHVDSCCCSRCSLPSAVPRAATDRADHAASVPPAALRTQSTRRADEPPGL
jgi:hypothetical protein